MQGNHVVPFPLLEEIPETFKLKIVRINLSEFPKIQHITIHIQYIQTNGSQPSIVSSLTVDSQPNCVSSTTQDI